MTTGNLAVVFGPSMLRPRQLDNMVDSADVARAVGVLIEHAPEFVDMK